MGFVHSGTESLNRFLGFSFYKKRKIELPELRPSFFRKNSHLCQCLCLTSESPAMLALLHNIRAVRYIKSVVSEGFLRIELRQNPNSSDPFAEHHCQHALEKLYHKSTSTRLCLKHRRFRHSLPQLCQKA